MTKQEIIEAIEVLVKLLSMPNIITPTVREATNSKLLELIEKL